jgi:predicted RNA-binding protein with TRAM domain
MHYERRERRGGRNFGPRRFPPKPVEMGKEYDVEILETSRRGDGIARIKGLVCFIPDTKPGDKVRVRITRISRRFAEAEVVGEAKPGEEAEAEEITEEVAKESEEAAKPEEPTEKIVETAEETVEAAEETKEALKESEDATEEK